MTFRSFGNGALALQLEVDDDSADESSESSVELEAISPFEYAGGIKAAATKLPIFRHCNKHLIEKVTNEAERITLAPDELLDMQDGGPLYIVESGAVVVTLGSAPSVVLGPGSVFNVVGMLRLAHEAEPFRPKGKKKQLKSMKNYAYETVGSHFNEESPPTLWTDKRRRGVPKIEKGKASSNDVLCFFNLCPNASAPPPGGARGEEEGWLPLRIVGAAPEVVPTIGGNTHFFRTGGATLAAVPLLLMEEVGCAFGDTTVAADNLRASLVTFKQNCDHLADMWRTIMSRCSSMFPGAPPEVLWALTELSDRREIEAGEVFVVEGTSGEAGESVILIDEGAAVVEKMLGDVGRTRTAVVGRLGPGAIIGDVCLIGAGIPRAASVRAVSSTVVIEFSVQGILAAIRQFPGIMQGFASHAHEVGNFMQLRLPQRQDVVSALEVFSQCKHDYCIELAVNSDWEVFIGGQPIIAPGNKEDGTLYVLEYGRCALELEGQGQVLELPSGCCFGDSRNQGLVVPANATMRALTPLVIALAIRPSVLEEARLRHYTKERPPWERRPPIPEVYTLRQMERIIGNVEMFSSCEQPFVRDLCKVVQTRGYMPGQTLFVEGSKDQEQQMFVVRGGQTCSEQGGQRLEVQSANTFGDLAMLGAVHRRKVTVRAQTFCFTIEIPRSSFQEAIVKHPEQREQFEQHAVQAMQDHPDQTSAQWPFLLSVAPFRFIYLLNLYAGQKLYKAEDPTLDTAAAKACAVLVLQGQVAIVNDEGEEVELLSPGQCFNEQIFLEIAASTTERVVPRTSCELQLVSKDVWDNILEEFPTEREAINASISTFLAERAAHKYGVKLSSPSVLRKSTLLRDASVEFAEEMCKHLESLMVVPGMTICVEGKEGDRMLLLLRGKAHSDSNNFGYVRYGVGYIFGEAMLLGLRPAYSRTVWATDLCILQALHKKDFRRTIQQYTKEKQLFSPMLLDIGDRGVQKIEKQVKSTVSLHQATTAFVSSICEHAEDKFFARGDVIIQHGARCAYGESDIFVILKGRVRVEDELGVLLYYLEAGSLCGEAGALGLETHRSINVRAAGEGFVHLVRLVGKAVKSALNLFPEEREFLDELHTRRAEARKEFSEKRQLWLRQTVLPALAQSPLFLGCPNEFLGELAAPLAQTTYDEGELICGAGEEGSSMLLLLSGRAVVETQHGEKLGAITSGGVMGEVAVLGLFEQRQAALRAASECHVLEVTSEALNRALRLEVGAPVKAAFEKLKATRLHQVERGLPMCTLEIGATKEDTGVRSVCLQAELIKLATGDIIEPLPDTDPCGPHFIVVHKGAAVLEIPVPFLEIKTVSVMPIEKGHLVIEGIAAGYGTQIRAMSFCELYRVRKNDYLTAVATVHTSKKEWRARFLMMEGRSGNQLRERGNSAQGIINGLMDHPDDPAIKKWQERKKKALLNVRPPGQLELYATVGSTLSVWSLPEVKSLNHSTSDPTLKRHRGSSTFTVSRTSGSSTKSSLRLPLLPATSL